MAELPPPPDGILLGYFIVSDDVERSQRFYTEVLGGRVLFSGTPTVVALANTWIVINTGGGPTDDKPTVTLETPPDPDRISSFLNFRVKDIEAVYAEWSARGAQFLTPPKRHQYETRCYIRDPDGYLIEVGQTTDPQGDWSPTQWQHRYRATTLTSSANGSRPTTRVASGRPRRRSHDRATPETAVSATSAGTGSPATMRQVAGSVSAGGRYLLVQRRVRPEIEVRDDGRGVLLCSGQQACRADGRGGDRGGGHPRAVRDRNHGEQAGNAGLRS